MFGLTRSSLPSTQGPPSVSLVVQATVAAPTPPTPPSLPAQDASVSLFIVVAALVPLTAPVMAPPSIILMPLLSASVAIVS